MFKIFTTFTLLSAVAAQDMVAADFDDNLERKLGNFRGNRQKSLNITVQNIAYQQPMSPFFTIVHNGNLEDPLFELGQPVTDAMKLLAEEGDTSALKTFYENDPNVSEMTVTMGAISRGQSASFKVTVNRDFPFVSFASMAVNTNDCFVGVSKSYLYPGQQLWIPGYDAGTEVNDELCSSIPGPACNGEGMGASVGGGENEVHIHRGVHGIADLNATDSDWRNPMLRVYVTLAA